jgi:18S rRNA (adenine1779-N6/adenine1780-N6)-dimethyltransferase
LRSSFLGVKEVLNIMERNYRIFCSMNSIQLEEGVVEDEEEEDEEMEVDDKLGAGDEDGMDMDGDGDDTPSFFKEASSSNAYAKTKSKRKKTKVAVLVREKIRKVLEDDTQLADQRSGKLAENDFLRLLHAFNSENLHFS